FHRSVDHLDLHSFPTRRSSDLGRCRFLDGIRLTRWLRAERCLVSSRLKRCLKQTFQGSVPSPCRSETIPCSLSSVKARSFSSIRSEEHTSELQSRGHLVCRLLL